MTKKNSILDRIDVREPCTESWEEMTGNEEVRFCSHCSKNVFDLSAYTRERAEKLIRDSNGGLCVRYRKDTRGRVVTAPPRFTQIKRQAKIAAGVLATTMSVASMAYSQAEPISLGSRAESTKSDRNKERNTLPGFVVSGVVTDVNGAIVAGVKVVLSNSSQTLRRATQTNSDGYYEFRNVAEGLYRIEFVSEPFKRHIVENLQISKNLDQPMSMELGENVTLMGVVGIAGEEIHPEDPPKVSNKIELQNITDLPLTTKFVLGPVSVDPINREGNKPASKPNKKLPK